MTSDHSSNRQLGSQLRRSSSLTELAGNANGPKESGQETGNKHNWSLKSFLTVRFSKTSVTTSPRKQRVSSSCRRRYSSKRGSPEGQRKYTRAHSLELPITCTGLTLNLDHTEIFLVRKTWMAVTKNGRGEPGEGVLRELIRQAPLTRSLFDSADQRWRVKGVRPTSHTVRFSERLAFVVDNLDRPEAACEALVRLGSWHATMPERDMFRGRFFDLFAEIVVGEVLKWSPRCNPVGARAWCRIGLFIAECMKCGFEHKLRLLGLEDPVFRQSN